MAAALGERQTIASLGRSGDNLVIYVMRQMFAEWYVTLSVMPKNNTIFIEIQNLCLITVVKVQNYLYLLTNMIATNNLEHNRWRKLR